jgi:hypothetical protein
VFHTRCPAREPVCAEREPLFRELGPEHHSRCHFDAFDLNTVAKLQAQRSQAPPGAA